MKNLIVIFLILQLIFAHFSYANGARSKPKPIESIPGYEELSTCEKTIFAHFPNETNLTLEYGRAPPPPPANAPPIISEDSAEDSITNPTPKAAAP